MPALARHCLCLIFLLILPAAAIAGDSQAKLKVRAISIEIRDIFDEPGIGPLYRTVNSLKITTKEEVVRRELLLKEGDDYDEFLLKESERNLRTLSFLRKASITPYFHNGFVDLLVSVQDTWTLYPILSFSGGGGNNNKAAGIGEQNLLGYGKRLEGLVAKDENGRRVEGVWEDDRLFNSNKQLILGYFQRSDGNHFFSTIGKPFRSLVDPNAWSINVDTFDLVQRLYKDGSDYYIYRQEHEAFTGGYTWSDGDPEKRLNRYTLGYNFVQDRFKQADLNDYDEVGINPASVSQDLSLLPDTRRFSGPFASFERLEADYISMNYIDRFERVEDFDVGRDFSISAHLAPSFLGSEENAVLVKAYHTFGWRINSSAFLRSEISTSGRAQDEGLTNRLLRGDLKFYDVLGSRSMGGFYLGKHTLASSLSLESGSRMDKDFQLLLGASTGLRGYEDQAFDGDQKLLFNIEDRFHLTEDVLRLVSIGGALFFDAGSTSYGQFGDLFSNNLREDIGFGLRLGLPRSCGGSVVRIDVAYPLQAGPDGRDSFKPLFLFSTGQAFSAHLPSEANLTQAARVSSGFLP